MASADDAGGPSRVASDGDAPASASAAAPAAHADEKPETALWALCMLLAACSRLNMMSLVYFLVLALPLALPLFALGRRPPRFVGGMTLTFCTLWSFLGLVWHIVFQATGGSSSANADVFAAFGFIE
jgi:hypothetical protein